MAMSTLSLTSIACPFVNVFRSSLGSPQPHKTPRYAAPSSRHPQMSPQNRAPQLESHLRSPSASFAGPAQAPQFGNNLPSPSASFAGPAQAQVGSPSGSGMGLASAALQAIINTRGPRISQPNFPQSPTLQNNDHIHPQLQRPSSAMPADLRSSPFGMMIPPGQIPGSIVPSQQLHFNLPQSKSAVTTRAMRSPKKAAPTPAPAPVPALAPPGAPVSQHRPVACIRCHLHWWNDTCDGSEPCNNCQADTMAEAECIHPKCENWATGTCKRGNKCKRAHEDDNYGSLENFRKTLKRVGKKTDPKKVAPSVRDKEISAGFASGSGSGSGSGRG